MSGDVGSYIGGLREDLGRAEERIRSLEDRHAALLRVLREAVRRHEAVRAAGLADEAYLPVSEEMAEVLAELADAIEGKRCPCGEGTEGDCPGAWHGCDWHDDEPEPEDYALEGTRTLPGHPVAAGAGYDCCCGACLALPARRAEEGTPQ